jgi:hypothetical protein
MRIFWRVLAALILLAAIAGIAWYAYDAGIAQGLAQKVQAPTGVTSPMSYRQFGHPFFGLGFGLLGCLVPLFLLFIAFGSMRALFWHGPMGWGHHMPYRRWGWRDEDGKGVPPFFAEWHRRAHTGSEEGPEKK